MRIAVVSAGGIGGPLAGFLIRNGQDVVVIDQWSDHVHAIEADGLHVVVGSRQDPEDEFTVAGRALELYQVCTLRDRFDIVFMACKSYDTRWLTELVRPHLADDGVLVSTQNSLNPEWIAPIVGAERVIACTLFAGGELLRPGHVWRTHPMNQLMYVVGELDGQMTPRLEHVASLLRTAGVTEVSSNIRGVQWTKLLLNTFSAVLSSLLDPSERTWQLAENYLYRTVAKQIYREGAAVAEAFGVDLEPLYSVASEDLRNNFDEAIEGVLQGAVKGYHAGARTMLQQDIARGRPTEIELLNGLIASKGAEVGIPAPANAAVTDLILRIESGELGQRIQNLETVAGAIGAALDRESEHF